MHGQAPTPAQRTLISRVDGTQLHVSKSRFIPEINGLRGLALALVVLFHLFGNGRVSGGIDVFLAITGFLFTRSFARQLRTNGRLNLGRHFARTAYRILPAALLVVVFVAIGVFLWLPSSEWPTIFPQITAAALYFENWQLISTATEYGAAGAAASPVQHYWSLSIQGQFYLLFPFVVIALALLATHLRRRPTRALFVFLAIATAVSFAYAVHKHLVDQPVAYFDSFTRFWEIGAGGLLAFAGPHVRLGPRLKAAAGWVGLALVISCGFVVDGASQFPGPLALWPVAGIALVILGAGATAKGAVVRALQLRPIRFLADVSYPLYLWHWPLAVFYLAATTQDRISLLAGLGLFATSILVAWITQRLVAGPAMTCVSRIRASRAIVAAAAVMAVVAGSGLAINSEVGRLQQDQLAALADQESALEDDPINEIEPLPNPTGPEPTGATGGRVITSSPGATPNSSIGASPQTMSDADFVAMTSINSIRAVKPPVAVAREDKPSVYSRPCLQKWRGNGTEVASVCHDNSAKRGSLKVAIVGGSHTLQWYTPFLRVARAQGWDLYTIGKDGCHFTLAPKREGKEDATCVPWNRNALKQVTGLKPDVVVTVGTRTRVNQPEYIHESDFMLWKELNQMGIKLILIRDTPRFSSYRPPCVEKTKDPMKCSQPLSKAMATVDPLLQRTDLPTGTVVVDMTDNVCFNGQCPPVVDNVFVYRDDQHISNTYSARLTNALNQKLRVSAPQYVR